MKTCSRDFFMVTSVSLLLFFIKCDVHAPPKPFQTTVYQDINNNTLICHKGFMSVYISKVQVDDLPFTIYVQDEQGWYYQAMAIAQQCHYFIRETETFVIFTAAFHGCFVRKQKNITSLAVVIMATAEEGRVEIAKPIPLICRREIKEEIKNDNLPVSRQIICNKDGFNITISQNATVPPLKMDTLWIPSSQNQNCKPQIRSTDSVTFSFPFTACGTRSVIADGILTYWVTVEAKHLLHKGSIFRETPFQLTVRCSFVLARMSQLGIKIQGEISHYPSALKSEGILRAELRFAKDSSYRSFYSSRGPPLVTKLGQPVYVEVFVLKSQDKELVLLLEDCWATPTKDPDDLRRWSLLVQGCPFRGDSHRTVVLPVVSSKELKYPSLHKWFVVKLFSFVKPREVPPLPGFQSLVYFHCDIEICKGANCSQSCSKRRRRLGEIRPRTRINHYNVSGGPFVFGPLV